MSDGGVWVGSSGTSACGLNSEEGASSSNPSKDDGYGAYSTYCGGGAVVTSVGKGVGSMSTPMELASGSGSRSSRPWRLLGYS